jgi:CRP/FNR family transcriptional regulator, anaerobic regulatory protein
MPAMSEEQAARVARALPILQRADPAHRREFMNTAYLARIPAGHDVFVEGDDVEGIALLLSGVVRVYKIGETGREITLYRFSLGDSCILTANAILSQRSFPAIATVEEDAEALMIPAAAFRDWVRRYDIWREYVFDLLSQRLASVLAIVDEVAFRRMDARVADLLLQRHRPGQIIQITHQQIAAELGSSREVISRILEDFASRQLVRSGRGTIEIVDSDLLRTRAGV